MTAKRKRFSIADKASIIEKSKHFSGTKAELAKSLGLATSTLIPILRHQDAFETKSDTLGNAPNKIKSLKASPYAELERSLNEWLHQARSANIPIN